MNKYFKRTKGRSFIPVHPKPKRELHLKRREGDENACSCGARWPVGDEHP